MRHQHPKTYRPRLFFLTCPSCRLFGLKVKEGTKVITVCGPNELTDPLTSWPCVIIIIVPSEYVIEKIRFSTGEALRSYSPPRWDYKSIYIWILCGCCWLDAAVIQQFNGISLWDAATNVYTSAFIAGAWYGLMLILTPGFITDAGEYSSTQM